MKSRHHASLTPWALSLSPLEQPRRVFFAVFAFGRKPFPAAQAVHLPEAYGPAYAPQRRRNETVSVRRMRQGQLDDALEKKLFELAAWISRRLV